MHPVQTHARAHRERERKRERERERERERYTHTHIHSIHARMRYSLTSRTPTRALSHPRTHTHPFSPSLPPALVRTLAGVGAEPRSPLLYLCPPSSAAASVRVPMSTRYLYACSQEQRPELLRVYLCLAIVGCCSGKTKSALGAHAACVPMHRCTRYLGLATGAAASDALAVS